MGTGKLGVRFFSFFLFFLFFLLFFLLFSSLFLLSLVVNPLI